MKLHSAELQHICYNWFTSLLKYITMGTYCAPLFVCYSTVCTGGFHPKRIVASPVIEFGFQL